MSKIYKFGKRVVQPVISIFKCFAQKNQLSKANAKECVNIQTLPVEIMTYIFEQLDFETRIRVERVCRGWRDIIEAHSWRHMTYYDSHMASLDVEQIEPVQKAEKRVIKIHNLL
uniref:F-box domain-containing protein n=1 Tax=Ditylenchus dipsaci TaxID=166011 RepID=A0A915EMK9_9BILA